MTKIVTCHKCEYEWETSSDMAKVTCPSCLSKTPKTQPQTPEVEA